MWLLAVLVLTELSFVVTSTQEAWADQVLSVAGVSALHPGPFIAAMDSFASFEKTLAIISLVDTGLPFGHM